MISLFIAALISHASAENWRLHAHMCPKDVAPHDGVVCCDTLSGLSCEDTRRALLSNDQQQLLDNLSDYILTLPTDNMIVQNCFHTALELVGIFPQNAPASLGPEAFFKALAEAGYAELPGPVADGDLKPLDVIVFDEVGQYKGWEENTNTSGKHPFWFEMSGSNHALVYLGQGMVVQKEDTFTAASTLSTLEHSYDYYYQAALKTFDKSLYTDKKIQLVKRVFRAAGDLK